MIPRYTRPEMAAIWASDHRLRLWLEIELCVLEAMADIGQVPRELVRAGAARALARGEELVQVQDVHEPETVT